MSSSDRRSKLAKSQQNKDLVEKAKTIANDPNTREKTEDARRKLGGREARIRLSSPGESTEIVVIDSCFKTVAYGLAEVDAVVAPGVYQLEYRAGPAVERKLVAIHPGTTYEELDIHVAMPSAAPIDHTSTSREAHQAIASELSQQLAEGAGSAGLVVLVRNLRGAEPLALDPGAIAGARVADRDGRPLDGSGDWHFHDSDGWASWSATLDPGGYVLRTASSDELSHVQLEQSVWLCEGWQTLIFVPNTADGPTFSGSSIHMARLHEPWTPWEDTEANLALEAALWGLRGGRSVVSKALVDLLLHSKHDNPMLGIVGLHALLLHPADSSKRVGRVLDALEDLVPGHPDLAALAWLAEEHAAARAGRSPRPAAPAAPVDWPPMMRAGYAALLRLDALAPGAIVDGSAAEGVAAGLVYRGTWTTWRAREPEPVHFDSVVTDRVASYLSSIAEVHGISRADALEDRADPQQISTATDLPRASVKRALAKLHDAEAFDE